MRMVLSALAVLAFVPLSVAQSDSWAVLSGLKEGQRIQIIETNSKKHSGQFRSVSDSAITFTEGNSERSVLKQDVRSINLQNSRRLRNTLIGTGAGAGAGAVFGAAACRGDSWFGPGACAAVVGLFGAVIGAPVGAVMPTHNSVYRSATH